VKIKEKGWIWSIIAPFSKDSFILLCGTIYCPKGKRPSKSVIRHEEVHMEQQKKYTWLLYHFLYLFCFPVLWNPWRKKWEAEAYRKGQKLRPEHIKIILRKRAYGWLL